MLTFSKPVGGYVSDDVSINCVGDGGDAGGVSRPLDAGCGPGEQNGRCLLGIGAGVPRCVVFSDSCGGGVEALRLSIGLASTAADISSHERGRPVSRSGSVSSARLVMLRRGNMQSVESIVDHTDKCKNALCLAGKWAMACYGVVVAVSHGVDAGTEECKHAIKQPIAPDITQEEITEM